MDLHKICQRVLSPTSLSYSNVTSTGFLSAHSPYSVRQYTKESSFLALRDKNLLNLERLTRGVMLSEKYIDQKGEK